MKNKIRLTESELINLIKKIIKEDDVWATHPLHQGQWFDNKDNPVEDDFEYTEERDFGEEEYEKFKDFINGCNASWCINVKKWFDKYSKYGPVSVRKKMD